MKVLVTGGSGFLGAWVVRRLLAEGLTPCVFDLNSDRRLLREIIGPEADALDWRVGDVTVLANIAEALRDCQVVIHLAGVMLVGCRENPLLGARVNLLGTLNVFEAAIALGLPKVVYASTAGVFGPADGRVPRPLTHYGAFKLATEGSARAYWEDHGIASVGFRPLIIYGPGREVGISAGPSLACRSAVRGEACTIGFSGTTGYVYVEDVSAAFVSALTNNLPGASVYNMVGEVNSVGELIEEIKRQVPGAQLQAAGSPLPITAEMSDADLYLAIPGLPKTSLRAGVAATIAHYQQHPLGAE
jgi:nucleoside-diphosphate-sugar epimerase